MSRAYRVRVRESVRKTVRAEDHVATEIELLEVLPREEMADLLRQELLGRGFRAEGRSLVRVEGGLTIRVDPETGEVEARSDECEDVELSGEREVRGDTDWGRGARDRAEAVQRDALKEDLEAQADRRATEAQKRATDRLEAALGDLRGELDRVVNRVTAEALKRKAGRLGRIKEVTEDQDAGSLTIVVEV